MLLKLKFLQKELVKVTQLVRSFHSLISFIATQCNTHPPPPTCQVSLICQRLAIALKTIFQFESFTGFKRMQESSTLSQEILTDYQKHLLSWIFLSQEALKCTDDIKEKNLSLNATLTFKHFPEGQLEEIVIFKSKSMNFIFQMYRQRFQSTTFHVTSTIYRQQAIKLEKLKQ